MRNRLVMNKWTRSIALLLCLLPCVLHSQQSFFNFSYPGPDTIFVGSSCSASIYGQLGVPTVTSTGGFNIVGSFFDSIQSGFGVHAAFFGGQLITVKWSVKDDANHFGTFSFPIQFWDSTAPILNLAGISPYLAFNSYDVLPVQPNVTATDNCTISSEITLNADETPLPIKCKSGFVYRTWDATDNWGNTAVFTQTIQIFKDTVAPTITVFPQNSTDVCANTQASYQTWLAAQIQAFKATDPSLPLEYSHNAPAIFPSLCNGVVTVTFTATDACGNTATATAKFTSQDTQNPIITATNTIQTENCGGGDDVLKLKNWIENHGNATVTDNCTTPIWTNFTWISSNGQSGVGIYGTPSTYPQIIANNCQWFTDVTFKVQDACGNQSSKLLSFKIQDTMAPIFGAFSAIDTIYCPNVVPANPTISVSDNCDANVVVTFSNTLIANNCAGNSIRLGTWTATDDCGNTKTATKTYVIRDTIAPNFVNFPNDLTLSCGMTIPMAVIGTDVTALDICGTLDNITMASQSTKSNDPSVCGFYQYQIFRTYTALDLCGNSRKRTQVITITDNQAPIITGWLDTIQSCSNITTLPKPTAKGFCDRPVAMPVLENQLILSGTCPDSYNTVLTWKATDVCNLTSTFTQTAQVKDLTKPVLSGIPPAINVQCNAIPPVPALGVITATDNCDEDVLISFLETEQRDPNLANCAHWSNYGIKREWTATDNCGNATTKTQFINVQDNTAPIVVCNSNILLPNQLGTCGANIYIPSPLSLVDDCTATTFQYIKNDTASIKNTSGQPSNNVAVDSILMKFSINGNLPAPPVVGSPSLVLFLENADAEQPDEFYQIYDENNLYLGKTSPTSAQCGNGQTILNLTSNQLNEWLSDGIVNIKLKPNGSGATAINAICPNGKVIGRLSYQYAIQNIPVALQYSIDGGNRENYPPSVSLPLSSGEHTVRFFATDCSFNEGTCSFKIKILDIEPPLITVPSNTTQYVGVNDCKVISTLQFPNLVDNCGFSGMFNQSSSIKPLKFAFDPNAQNVPQDIELEIPNAAMNAVGAGTLMILHQGDNAQFGEFFKIIDENGVQLSTTTNGVLTNECNAFHSTTIPISMSQINAWTADGTVKIKLIANKDAGNFQDFISPCGPLLADGTDGISKVQLKLSYSFADVSYEIKDFDGELIKTGLLQSPSINVELPAGTYTTRYFSQDENTNIGENQFNITVLDTVAPIAKCLPTTIFTNASGTSNYTLNPNQIDNGSFDNCAGNLLTKTLSTSVFSCNDAGQTINVTMTVQDPSGNTSSCVALVKIESANFQPTISTDVCEQTTVQLFANPPVASGNSIYTYLWSGPNGFASTNANPILPQVELNDEGTYYVTVTGLTGCTASGIALLDIQALPQTPNLTANKPSFCIGDDFILQSNTYSGVNVTYSWYAGMPNSQVLLGTTTQPDFLISQPPVGNFDYFLKVNADGCTSQQSAVLDLNVFQKPLASVQNPLQVLCEGDALTLGTNIQGSGVSYNWTGPDGFVNSQQFPPVFNSVSITQSGQYSLVITENGCPSAPAYTQVSVKPKPATPQLANNGPACAGEPLTLICNVLNANEYVWVSPFFDTTITLSNAFSLPSVTTADSGSWHVYVTKQGCSSDLSPSNQILVQSVPSAAASSNSPICTGTQLNFQASSSIPNVIYHWTGPNNFASFDQNPIANGVPGEYILITSTPIGCADTVILQAAVVQTPSIATLSYQTPWINNIQGCVSGTDDLQLQAVMVQPGAYNYYWTGPGGFTSTDESPLINNANASLNGTYNLQVKTLDGCESMTKTLTVDMRNRPNTPLLSSNSPVCEGNLIELNVINANEYVGNNINYAWTLPNGSTQTNIGGLQITATDSANHSGNYQVVVSVDGCPSLSSPFENFEVYNSPITPAITANTPICDGETLNFSAPVLSGVSYFWSGPNGFSSAISNPSLIDVNANHAGEYFLAISKNGCLSEKSEPLLVEVKPMPLVPFVQNDGAICLNTQNETLTLSIGSNTLTPDALYAWYNASTQVILGAPVLTQQYLYTGFNGISEGQTSFYAIANLNGCFSEPSNLTTVTFDEVPANQAYAGADQVACNGITATLSGTSAGIGQGLWTLVSGTNVSIVNPNSSNTQVLGGTTGQSYNFAWTLSKGACKNYSSDTVAVQFKVFETAEAANVIDTCFATSAYLLATPPTNGIGKWSQPVGQDFLQIEIADPLDPNTLVNNLEPGNTYFFYWTLSDLGCGASTDTLVLRSIGSVAFAGEDLPICDNDGCTSLLATQVSNYESGLWTSENPLLEITSSTSHQTEVCNLQLGENILYWTTNNGQCGDKSRDTVVLSFEQVPVTVDDTVFISFGSKENFKVLSNDILPTQYQITITSLPRFGNLDTTGVGTYIYQPNLGFSGSDVFTYEVCNLNCASACSFATVTLTTERPSECEVPSVFTPNEDGVNDFFFIPCFGADVFPDNEVTIFNEWGDEVFHAQPYNNNWNGEYSGQSLPTGTYFYVVKLNGSEGVKSGFVILQR
jgi:gliding motility-associated-like protein